jgi:hypothetical protein
MKLNDLKQLELGGYRVVLDGFTVHFVFEVGSMEQTVLKKFHDEDVLFEGHHRGTPLGGQYSAALHRAHIQSGQAHLHIFAKRNQLAALNMDGTAHDASHGVRLPNRVVAAIQSKFPQFTIPPDGFIESAEPEIEARYAALLKEHVDERELK